MNAPPVFVIGMHGSGLGPVGQMIQAARHGPNAPLDSASLQRANEAILFAAERHWADPKPFAAPSASAVRHQITPAAGEVLADPRLSLTLGTWLEQTPQALAVHVLRNPGDVLARLMRRHDLSQRHAELIWQAYLIGAERQSRALPRVTLRFEDLFGPGRDAALEDLAQTLAPDTPALRAKLTASARVALDPALASTEARDAAMLHVPLSAALWDLMTQPESTERAQALDALYGEWSAQWTQRSKGKGASQLAREMPGWHSAQARGLADAGMLTQAAQAQREATRRAPRDKALRFDLAKALWRDNQYSAALDEVTRLIDLVPHHAPYRVLRARIWHRLRHGARALADLDAALRINPEHGDAFHLRGLVHERAGEVAAARRDLLAALEHAPGRPGARAALARINATQTAPVIAQRLASATATGNAEEAAALAEAQTLAAEGHTQRAYMTIAPYLASPHASSQIIDYCIGLLDTLGRTEQIHGVMTRLTSQRTPLPETQVIYARHRAEAGDWARATEMRAAAQHSFARARLDDGSALSLALQAWRASESWAQALSQVSPAGGPVRPGDWPYGTQLGSFDAAPISHSPDACELSVMVPVHNVTRPDWLMGALRSVLAQTDLPERTEIVVVADGVLDEDLGAALTAMDPRLRVVHVTDPPGILANHNRCLSLARGTFVHILHQDDYLRAGFYEALLPPLRKSPRIAMSFCATEVQDAEDRTLRLTSELRRTRGVLESWPERIACSQLVRFPAVVLRRAACLRLGGFSPSLSYAFDWHYWARLAMDGEVWFDPAPAAVRRNHAGSATFHFSPEARFEEMVRVAARHMLMLPDPARAKIARHAFHRVVLNGLRMVPEGAAEGAFARLVQGAHLPRGANTNTDANTEA